MSRESNARGRLFKSAGDRAALIAILALTAAIIIISALYGAGLCLVQGALYIFLPLLLALTAVGWGFSGIIRRVHSTLPRRVVTAVLMLILFGLTLLAAQFGSFAAGLNTLQKYVVLTSPEHGRRLIVMRGLDIDEGRVNARRDARLAEQPDGPADYAVGDYGYVYKAYAPGPLDLFYKPATLVEGEVYIGYATGGELMMEWQDDETVGWFYVRNPGPGDGGEMRARCDV